MTKIKKVISLLALFCLLTVITSGCGIHPSVPGGETVSLHLPEEQTQPSISPDIRETEPNARPEDPETYPEPSAILISRSTNFAFGYADGGWFLDESGHVYEITYSTLETNKEDQGLIEDRQKLTEKLAKKLSEKRNTEMPLLTIDAEQLKRIMSLGEKIQPNNIPKIETEFFAVDAGCNQVYFVDRRSNTTVLCRETGCYRGQVKDQYVESLIKEIESIETQIIESQQPTTKVVGLLPKTLVGFNNI